jgi:4-oxalocrotonate tautomerase
VRVRIDILFYDIARHDWAIGGTLWSDRQPAPGPG